MHDEVKEELDRLAADEDQSLDGDALQVALRDIYSDPPVVVERDELIHELVHKMKRHQTNAALIVDDAGAVVGIFTERDLLARVVGRPVDWFKTTVADVMTPDPDCLQSHDTLAYALNYMHVGGYGHVPIVDAQRRPVALISLKEVVHYLAEAFPEQLSNLPPGPARGATKLYGG